MQDVPVYGTVKRMTKQQAQGIAGQVLRDLGKDSLDTALQKIEGETIAQAMEEAQHSCQDAARRLNSNRTTIVEKRKRFGMKMGIRGPGKASA